LNFGGKTVKYLLEPARRRCPWAAKFLGDGHLRRLRAHCQVLRTPDVNVEFLFDPDLCRAREIQSLVAVPVYHDGNIVGALELYFDARMASPSRTFTPANSWRDCDEAIGGVPVGAKKSMARNALRCCRNREAEA